MADRKYSNQTGKRKGGHQANLLKEASKGRGNGKGIHSVGTALSMTGDVMGTTLAIPYNIIKGAVPPIIRGEGVRGALGGAAKSVNKSLADVKARNARKTANDYNFRPRRGKSRK